MASAAYWIGSSAKEIIASGKTARIGSIGTMISMRKPYGEIIEIYADDSKDKNKAYIEALNGNPTPIKEEMLNPLNDIFLASVKQNRGAKLDLDKENVLTGKVYLAEDAVKYGLIDAIGTFEYAVERVTELAKTNQSFNYNYNYSSMKFKASWAALLALVGFTASASEKDLPAVSEEHFEKFNAEVAALQAAKAALEAENARLTAEHKIACDAATDMNVHVTDLSAQVTALTAETYGAQPGALSTNPKKEKDEIEPAVSWVDPNAEHNKTLQSIGK
jgi:ClpP class serine protease